MEPDRQPPGTPAWPLDLLDWKRRIAALYSHVRDAVAGSATLTDFRAAKDALVATHPQSPVPTAQRATFGGLAYFAYRPDLRLHAALEADPDPHDLLLPSSTDEPFRFRSAGRVHLTLGGHAVTLTVYWLTTYGGGLFLPFRDSTSGAVTYGAGRYLLDTVKGADLGTTDDGELILDFNYAYNPSCAYDPSWSCPLAPADNRLDVAVEAGERLWSP